ncbi:MAG TPA: F0F1 ATP synthase subunit gamma [Oscillatoriales cyanobacterium M59_W2019_021]|nr:MAG: ATPase F1F0 subunit gamma [Cyanobacteria bacterium J055]HIK30466.1 F0F1 ATP synthase subunit gamma [Oscillatoriales cyanobacterium M4454_W2019_049]HIK49422.1 F0F1 ATP synthase subunit gamma [Oscillatoriales cyanobacterium M59_W2019_021]
MTLEALKRKIDTARDLQSVVKTMKTLAAVSIRQYEKAAVSLSEYNRTLQMGMQILLKTSPESLARMKPFPTDRLGVVAFGSDQGMCGQFNERIAEFTLGHLDALPIPPPSRIVLTVGTRLRDRLETAGQRSENCSIVPGSIAGIVPLVQETVLTLESWRREHHIDRILVFNNRPISGAAYHPRQRQIFPLNIPRLRQLQQKPWNSSTLPTFTMNPERLVSALFRQHFFVSLYRSCVESLASENASRLASMQIAEKNIQERLSELQAEFHHQRQEIVTEELLDIVSGFESVRQSE